MKILTIRKLLAIALGVLISVGPVSHSQAIWLSPGEYRGTYVVDRWGRKHFDSMLVTDEAASTLEPYRGKVVSATVTKISQEENPGIGTIHAIEKVEVMPVAPDLILSITGKAQRVEEGQVLTLTLSMKNRSLDPVYLRPGHDEIDLYIATVITDHLRQTRLVDDKSGSGQWVSESFRVENGKVFRQGLLQIPLRWRDPEYVARGENIKLGKDLYGYKCVVVLPQGRFSADVPVCRKFPPGEYEAYWRMYHSIGKSAGLGPVSGRFSFDVIGEAGGDPK